MKTFLSFDSSTQGLKTLIIEPESGKIIAHENINYTKDLPEYKCKEGVLDNPDPLVKHSNPLMWVAALDLVLEKLKRKYGTLMGTVEGISGSGQQHGSVYLNASFEEIISRLNSRKTLAEQIAPTLSRQTSPIWMDSSTTAECKEITETVGYEKMMETGSPATERFTGPQIRKFFKESPKSYEQTEIIHLVSSFMASVMIGKSSLVDFGDGAGMNLLNLNSLSWDIQIARATAPGLLSAQNRVKLPHPVPSDTILGGLHPYFKKYGLRSGIPILVWSGDNPNSLVGVGATSPGTAVISLGTSDTFFAAMENFIPDPNGYGHIFGNPAGGFMSLICFKNGSLAREKVKEACGVDWNYFGTTAFENTEPGNNGNMMLPYFFPEITPRVLKPGIILHGEENFRNNKSSIDTKIRAIVESQILSMKLHSQWIGNFSVIRITGGASESKGICQVIADVFNAEIEKISVVDSAALGAALRAANAIGEYNWEYLYQRFCAPVNKLYPDEKNNAVYEKNLKIYASLEKSYLNSESQSEPQT